MRNIVFEFGGPNPFKGAKSKSMIELLQTGYDRFTVTYGLQRKTGLPYGIAAKELGECLMHHQACEGLLDNE